MIFTSRHRDFTSREGYKLRLIKESNIPIQLNKESGGKLLAIRVSGKLASADYGRLYASSSDLSGNTGNCTRCSIWPDFSAGRPAPRGADTKFAAHRFSDIDRLAMVGEEGMATFCESFTKATVRYFDHADAADARKCLDEVSAN